MSTSTPQWTWDPNRQSYYYWSSGENCFVYHDGSRLFSSSPQDTATPTQTANSHQCNPHQPRYVPSTYTAQSPMADQSGAYQVADCNYVSSLSSTMQTMTIGQGWSDNYGYQPQNGATTSTSSALYDPQQQFIATTNANSNIIAYAGPNGDQPTFAYLELGPSMNVTDAKIFAKGIRSKGIIRSSLSEEIPSGYKKRTGTYFKPGRVFNLAYCQLHVVVNRGPRYATCLPISTYEGRGCGKSGAIKSHHAIIHTSKTAPEPHWSEYPKHYEEEGMRSPIRVTAKEEKLDAMSRVIYRKAYSIDLRATLEVLHVGEVHRNSMRRFQADFLKANRDNSDDDSESDDSEADAARDPYQDGLDDDENSGADNQDKGGHST